MPIDYSKWDNIDCSSSEEEEEETRKTPRVTRLDGPSRVTRTKEGELVVEEVPLESTPTVSSVTNSNKNTTHVNTAEQEETKWTEKGSVCTTPSGSKLYWSQDRYSVTLRLALPSKDITAKDIQVELTGVLPYHSRSIAVGNDNQASLQVSCQSQIILQGQFPHPVHATEDDESNSNNSSNNNQADWELDRTANNGVFLVLTLQKATPMDNMTIWWRQPLQGYPEIQPTQPNTDKAQAFQKAWEEAHRQFREKAKKGANNDI